MIDSDVKEPGPAAWYVLSLIPLGLYIVYWWILPAPVTNPVWLLPLVPIAVFVGLRVGQLTQQRTEGPRSRSWIIATQTLAIGATGAALLLAQALSPTAMEWLGLGMVLLVTSRAGFDSGTRRTRSSA
ncbi:hypothetical protein GCM10009623_36550 [Nocardioides aestuarii]|uniref:DUF308 domain-containing protein n=1 Tax=Nocardioides aestuarii TaxID=252231 RepID=A0ABW4TSK6_9ACTN